MSKGKYILDYSKDEKSFSEIIIVFKDASGVYVGEEYRNFINIKELVDKFEELNSTINYE